jgi:hypothetical protein
VLTVHLADEAGSPTVAARDEVLAFLASSLTDAAHPASGNQRAWDSDAR